MGNKPTRQSSGRKYAHNGYAAGPGYDAPPHKPPVPAGEPDQRHQHFPTALSDTMPTDTNNYTRIGDNYQSLEQVQQALSHAGLQSSALIVGIDFTKSNEWSGKGSFNGWSLHDLVHSPNPYEQAISVIGKTLSSFDEDNLIPCFGFGDASTHDLDVFSFYPDNRPCDGFEEALARYREIVPNVGLSGPTSFAPIIETAIEIVGDSGGQFHVLLIIADGQVTRSVDTPEGAFSAQEQQTIDAIVKASEYPLSIILVGVGDGPWDMMRQFDDHVPARAFDNFQFVNFTEIMTRSITPSKKEVEFALAALMEIPSQYKAARDLHLLGTRKGAPSKAPLPPPVRGSSGPRFSRPNAREHCRDPRVTLNERCPVCEYAARDLALSCGHRTCYRCGEDLHDCPVCGAVIGTKIRLR